GIFRVEGGHLAASGVSEMTTEDELAGVPEKAERNPAFDVGKARRAAKDPERPGEKCRAPAGRYVPKVDRKKCQGKADCVAVCPYGVFEVGKMDDGEYRALPMFSRLKLWAHGKKTAYTPRADDCRA